MGIRIYLKLFDNMLCAVARKKLLRSLILGPNTFDTKFISIDY